MNILESAKIQEYAKRFARLRTDKNRYRWTAITFNRAPHKPLLLLSVLDLFDQGEIETNLIEITPDLGQLFSRYWTNVLPFDHPGKLVLPFFHLRNEEFWRLLPKEGKETALNATSQISSLSRLRETVSGARLDEALYEILHVREAREHLRAVLVETYFAPEVRSLVAEQSAVNHEAFLYSKRLLDQHAGQVAEEASVKDEIYRPAARDQGFRRALVTAYAHRCALCGVRVRTMDGHTVVDAAHICPRSVSYDDRPANGMALCRTCHWAFDEGLLGVSRTYEIFTSSQLRAADNLSGYLSSLQGRGIVRPAEDAYWPDTESLAWHYKQVFRPV